MYKIFYHPNEINSAAADFIPFFDNGTFHLFYLFDHRNNAKYGEGVAWYKIETKDFLTFVDKGEMIPRGTIADYDMNCFTGGVIKHDDKYHIFYTGHNVYIKTHGYQNEVIMHAVSDNLDNWVKIPEDTFFAPDGYDRCDFRDPFVYFDESDNLFYMLLCVRKYNDNALRNGETIRMKSTDLKKWEFDRPIYTPRAFQTHECPDLFKIGNLWYLIFSEYSDRSVTCYRIADSPQGPWRKPKNDNFDGRAYYAAKTAFDGNKRYLFGWVPTRMNNKDYDFWMWGGNLVVHEIKTNDEGELIVTPPQQVINAFNKEILKTNLIISEPYGCNVKNIFKEAPSTCLLSFSALPSTDCDRFGILIKQNEIQDNAYEFRFDLANEVLYANRFPCFPQNQFSTYQLHRKLRKTNKYDIKLFKDNDVFVLYVNDEIALSLRVCESFGEGLGLYVGDGEVKFENISLSEITE